METKEDEWKLLHRKMVDSALEGRNFVINVMRREPNVDLMDFNTIKIMLFETTTSTNDSFIFTDKDLLS